MHRSIGELIVHILDGKYDSLHKAEDALLRHGVALHQRGADLFVDVSSNHPGLKRIFAQTSWSNYKEQLARLEGAMEVGPRMFAKGGVKQRAIRIPANWFGIGPQADDGGAVDIPPVDE